MRSIAMFLALLAAILAMPGCAMPNKPASRTYGVDSAGNVSAQTRSALNGSTAAGPQEIIGVYIPFIGTGLAVKAGLEWDGTSSPIIIPVGQEPTFAAPAAGACATTRTVMVPETYYETETRQVPRTRMVPRQVPAAAIPLPAEAAPCAPPPAAAPRACPEPVTCRPGEDCGIPIHETAAK